MSGIEGSYRRDLAKTLRDTDKENRPDMLRSAKGTYDYVSTHAQHNFESFRIQQAKQLENIVESANTLDELKGGIANAQLFIGNHEMRGIDHSEHLLKRIELAQILSCPDVVPKDGGLREKVTSLLENDGAHITHTIDSARYRKYLETKLSSHNFSQEQIERVVEKVPADVFCSLDTDIEAAVIELNALSETTTLFSCAGHTDLPHPEENDSYAHSGYLFFSSQDSNLIERVRSLTGKNERFEVTLENKQPGDYTIRFRKIVPEGWRKTHGRKTREDLFEKSKQELAPILGKEILAFPIEKYRHDEYSYLLEIQRLQNEFIKSHPEAATMPYGWNSNLLTRIKKHTPTELAWAEYKEYYLSQEAEHDRLAFLKKLAKNIAEYRLSLY